ncbi:hypothetical protein D1797_11390 [Salmonella enterica subsp. enterica serovar Freetown]|nr:hypothetical protein [Salmonella enterica subsp. enterica serovar Freetown]EBH8789050.1 hypothetical protein [Salmonella enterica subsp. enterica serovar Freetown]
MTKTKQPEAAKAVFLRPENKRPHCATSRASFMQFTLMEWRRFSVFNLSGGDWIVEALKLLAGSSVLSELIRVMAR